MSELHAALGQSLGKLPADQADYTEKGPPPFTCSACGNFIPEPVGQESCQIVEGPYEDGGVEPADTCRLWTAKSPEEQTPQEAAPDQQEA